MTVEELALEKLAEGTIDCLQDGQHSIEEFIAALLKEAKSQAAQVAKDGEDYTLEELEYWEQVGYEVQLRDRNTQQAVRDFLWAVGKGHYFTSPAELAGSAFVVALQKAVA